MKKFLRFFIISVFALGVALAGVFPRVQADTYKDPYDPEKEGVVSGYLCVDREGGYIRGIAFLRMT